MCLSTLVFQFGHSFSQFKNPSLLFKNFAYSYSSREAAGIALRSGRNTSVMPGMLSDIIL